MRPQHLILILISTYRIKHSQIKTTANIRDLKTKISPCGDGLKIRVVSTLIIVWTTQDNISAKRKENLRQTILVGLD